MSRSKREKFLPQGMRRQVTLVAYTGAILLVGAEITLALQEGWWSIHDGDSWVRAKAMYCQLISMFTSTSGYLIFVLIFFLIPVLISIDRKEWWTLPVPLVLLWLFGELRPVYDWWHLLLILVTPLLLTQTWMSLSESKSEKRFIVIFLTGVGLLYASSSAVLIFHKDAFCSY